MISETLPILFGVLIGLVLLFPICYLFPKIWLMKNRKLRPFVTLSLVAPAMWVILATLMVGSLSESLNGRGERGVYMVTAFGTYLFPLLIYQITLFRKYEINSKKQPDVSQHK